MVLRPANNDISKWHFTGFPQRAAQPLLSVPATVLRLPLVGTRRAGKALDGPYSDICDVAAACGLRGCLTKVSAIMCRPFFMVCSTEFVVCREDFKFKAIC
jgi:hypothetical protein